ncbi:Plus3-like protein [Dioscorea alata]|uniref:Plus3-like protein n=3 Tax=Dioscorea alata TaxID=55571 RepID=A0ACB7UZG5_DIOAL|nr:Plus3-like protein [Dioscorea alata]KAH7666097.1 Plus3-like protein [Dioscorea alata]
MQIRERTCLSEKKASLLWNAESFNIMILPPQCPNVGESSKAQDTIDRNLNQVQLEINSESKNSNREAPPSPPQSVAGMQPISLTLIHEQHSRSYGRMGQFGSTSVNLDNPEKDKNEEILHSKSISRGDEVWKNVKSAVDVMPGAFKLDNKKGPGDLKLNSTQVECEPISNFIQHFRGSIGTRKDNLLGLEGKAEDYSSEKHDFVTKLPSIPRTVANEGLNSENVRSNISTRVIECADNFQSLGKQGMFGREAVDLQDRSEVRLTAPAQASDEHVAELRKASLLGKSAPTQGLLNKSESLRSHSEGNEHINSHKNGRDNVSKDSVDSHESVESSNSKEVSSTRKRELAFEPEPSLENKRLKTQAQDKFCSGSFHKQESSFMNWISTMTNGFSRSYQEKPLNQPLPIAHDTNKGSCTNIGFGSIFHSLHSPRLLIQDRAQKDPDSQRVADVLSEQDDREQASTGAGLVGSDGLGFNLQNAIGTSGKATNSSLKGIVCHEDVKLPTGALHSNEELKQATCVDEALPLNTIYISSGKSHEKAVGNIGNFSSYGKSFPSSSQKALTTTLEGKAIGTIPSGLNGSSNLVSKKRGAFRESLWISRLLPKASVSIPEPANCSHGVELSNEKYTKITEKSCPSLFGQKSFAHGTIKAQGHSDSDGSNGTNADGSSKSKLNCKLPSQKLIKSEPMASVFARRLDAIKHITPAKTMNDKTSMLGTCFFCGKIGHSLKECPQLTESELQDILQDLNSYDNTDGFLSICIRCFGFNHWAISCPFESSKIKNIHANNDRRIVLWHGVREQHQLINDRAPSHKKINSAREQTGLAVPLSLSPDEKGLPSDTIKENLRESTSKANQSASLNMNNVLKVDHSMAICNMFDANAGEEPSGTFQMIRQLQLSRTDVIRLMNSPVSNVGLEGFFLRLRVGKGDEDCGHSGYRVARICGARSKYCISVNIGCSQCSVDCRFISNHGFTEDELKTWWDGAVKGSSKVPTNEELNEKLQQRVKFGF